MKQENVMLGLIGAILGVVLGGAVWVVLGQMGYIYGVAGFLIVFLSVKGYEKLGGTISKKGILICILISVFMIFAAEFVSTGMILFRELKADGITVMEAMMYVPELWKDPAVKEGLMGDLMMGYIFAIICSIGSVRRLWKES